MSRVSLEEYLGTLYRPDCEYVDGLLVERNVGMRDHSELVVELIVWFHLGRKDLGVEVYPSQRIRISTQRYRVPDVCVMSWPDPEEQIFTTPPHICIEVLSGDDTFTSMQERIDDFLS